MDSNLTEQRPTFVSHLECSATGASQAHEADALHGLSRAGKPLLVRYDLAALDKAVDKESLVMATVISTPPVAPDGIMLAAGATRTDRIRTSARRP